MNYFAVSVDGGSLIIQSCFDTNGNSIMSRAKVGDRFITQLKDLEKSKSRAIKTNNIFTTQKIEKLNLLIINYHYFRNCTYKSGSIQ